MNNKRNIIVMFLFVMLSFAIISEVSAVSDAEADGTGFDLSIKSVNITNPDFASESNDGEHMQNHDNDCLDDLKSHNEQNSFNKSSYNEDKNIENRNFYEHDVNERIDDIDFNSSNVKPIDFNQTFDNMSDLKHQLKPVDDFIIPNFTDDKFNQSNDLRDSNFTAVRNGEAMGDIVSNLIGLNNITPNFKKDDKDINMSNPKPLIDGNVSDQHGPDAKNVSAMLPADIKNVKNIKLDKKSKKNKVKKNSKKVKSFKKSKKSKKLNLRSLRKIKMGMAKL